MKSRVWDVFAQCDEDIRAGLLIRRSGKQDKEFHFQDWFGARLNKLQLPFDPPGRNTYPDYRLVGAAEGYEVKGLKYPGREADYDCNSQVPTGQHNSRTIFYVFGRYPSQVDKDEYPVVDLVICHGDLLNAHRDYVHKNKSVKAFGSYGDIRVRDRKMYVAPTPFALLSGTTGVRTLIVPADWGADNRFREVGHFQRTEVPELLSGYQFDLKSNQLTPSFRPNETAGASHYFKAYRLASDPAKAPVHLAVASVQAPTVEDDSGESNE